MMVENTPQVETLIEQVMTNHPMVQHTGGIKARADYFEDVHQHLAPLARALERDNARLRNALENCRLLAAKNRTQEWSQHILRFCVEAGLGGSPLRDDD